MKTIIYKAKSPSGKEYIGITKQKLSDRVTNHFCDSRRNYNYPFGNALRKYGKEIIWEVLFEVDSYEDAKIKEVELIKEYNTLTPNGYNATVGGEGVSGFKKTPEQVAKMKLLVPWSKGAKFSEEHKSNLSMARTGLKVSNEGLEIIRTERDLRSKKKGRFFSIHHKDGTFIKNDYNIQRCSREFNTHPCGILKCIRGEREYSGSYIFKSITREEYECSITSRVPIIQLSD